MAEKVPENIRMKSLYTNGLNHQTFSVSGSEGLVYEFGKSMFEQGQRIGTVRLGLKLEPVSLFSAERIVLLATIAFFIFAMVPFLYYGITLSLQPFKDIGSKMCAIVKRPVAPEMASGKTASIDDVIARLDQTVGLVGSSYNNLRTTNVRLEAQKGLNSYEKRRTEQILDSLHYGIMITDTRNCIVHINSQMLRLLGKERQSVIQKTLDEVLDHEEMLSFLSADGELSQQTQQCYLETTFPGAAPDEIFQVALLPLADVGGATIGKIAMARNISDEKAGENAKHEFVAHVAHELRAPLTTIKSYNEMLMDGEIDDLETQKEFYNTINEETDRLARLIENLLNMSKIEIGNLSLDNGLVKTDWLLKDCVAAIEAPAQKKHIHIEKKLPDNWPSLVGDKELLKVALINVLGNAVKYSPDNKTITISLKEEDRGVVFDVVDQGYGISEVDLKHIFDQFYRSSDPNISDKTGSGLGLAMTDNIIRLHGGHIEVESTPGKGTHFSLCLPKEDYHLGKE
jgi:signal transduction histidine kinase